MIIVHLLNPFLVTPGLVSPLSRYLLAIRSLPVLELESRALKIKPEHIELVSGSASQITNRYIVGIGRGEVGRPEGLVVNGPAESIGFFQDSVKKVESGVYI
jgi:hypothetical protein